MSLAVALDQPTAYDRAVDYVANRDTISHADLSKALGVTSGVARGFMIRLAQAKLIGPPNDIGRAQVLANYNTSAAPISDHGNAMATAAAVSAAVDGALDKLKIESDDVITGAAQTRLRTIVDRIQRLREDRAVIMNDIAEVYNEAKGEGFDTKILRKVVAILEKDKVKRDEENAILDLYLSALGVT